ncbi:MAG: DUF3857 domain-containing protein [Methanobacteriota archaeon]|nr:MAG: DUF3857 domain-containing protein [Euryarchaeota archaeon]
MKALQWRIVLSTIFLFWGQGVYAGDDFQWAAVTQKDWDIRPWPPYQSHQAVMIFEKISSDDRKMIDEKCYQTIYRRIRILGEEGREWGDVVIPYFDKYQKIEKIYARTLLPDGTIIPLTKAEIREKEILKADGIKIKQKSFSLPRVSSDCIVEYAIKMRTRTSISNWVVQKRIPLIRGEFHWKVYRGRGISEWLYNLFSEFTNPNFVLLPKGVSQEISVEKLPSEENIKEFRFHISNVPPFQSEPYTLPENVLKIRLRLYYGSPQISVNYWADRSLEIKSYLLMFTRESEKLDKIVAAFDTLSTRPEKIAAAYRWVREHLKNISFLKEEEEETKEGAKKTEKIYKPNRTVDEALERGYATQEEIDFIFYEMLNRMHMKPALAFVSDRDKVLFDPDAKYWQFQRMMVVLLGTSERTHRYYSPGDFHLSRPGAMPYLVEGTTAFVVSSTGFHFVKIPYSIARNNPIERVIHLNFNKQWKADLQIQEKHGGHNGRHLWLLHELTDEDERKKLLQEKMETLFPGAEIDSLSLHPPKDEPTETDEMELFCHLHLPPSVQQVGQRVLIKPLDFMSQLGYKFEKDERIHDIQFDYAYVLTETLKVAIPQGWRVEAYPEDTRVLSRVGRSEIHFEKSDAQMIVRRRFQLTLPYWKVSQYSLVRNFFDKIQAQKELTLVLIPHQQE